ncbi:MAG: FkbM family methyltransferase [Saprospiraceae bacterium]|nr:FkbM family methyltransferase [Saprospiraceae bacterium]
MKIDTEGAEIDILKSASKILQNPSIRFICELHPFAWKKFEVQYHEFENIMKQFNRTITLLDPQKQNSELPYYGTVLF